MNKHFNILLFIVCCFTFSLYSANDNSGERKKTVCLNMIVKNEKDVITRCLESVKPIIDTWVIVDTGSTDGTQQVIKDYLKDIPGELYERPWVNFAFNRQEALMLAKNKADYILIVDADDILSYADDFVLPDLTADFYAIPSRYLASAGEEEVWIHRLVNTNKDWFWEGVLHEDLLCKQSAKGCPLQGVKYLYIHDGARAKDPDTWKKDAKILNEAIVKDPNNPRNYFYLGRTYLAGNQLEESLQAFQKRANMPVGNQEEIYLSKLQVAKVQILQDKDIATIQKSLIDAHLSRPSRMEALYYYLISLRKEENHDKEYAIVSAVMDIPPQPHDILFVEKWIWDYGLLFEYAFSAANTGHYKESWDACQELLARQDLPEMFRKDVENCCQYLDQQNTFKINNLIQTDRK